MTSNIPDSPTTNHHEPMTWASSGMKKGFFPSKQYHNALYSIDCFHANIPHQHVHDNLLQQQQQQQKSRQEEISILDFSNFPVGEEARTKDMQGEKIYEPLPLLDVPLLETFSTNSSANEQDEDCAGSLKNTFSDFPFSPVKKEATQNNEEIKTPPRLPQLETTRLDSFKTNTPRNECDWSLTDACSFLPDLCFSSPLRNAGDDDCSFTGVQDILSETNYSTGTRDSIPTMDTSINPSSSASSFSLARLKKNNVLSSDNQMCDLNKIKPHHEEKWNVRYKELQKFIQENGHGAVPHTYPKNQQLARWVKRQRSQYKLLQEGKASTITPERLQLLSSVGFVWDSHEVSWREKLTVLKEFQASHRHCNVPSNYKDKKLATWVKCQRRQYKLYWQGQTSAMSPERILALEDLGFEWELRFDISKSNRSTDDCQLLQEEISEF